MGLKEYFGNNLCPKFPTQVKRQIIEEQDGKCDRCGEQLWFNLEIHHRIPEKMWIPRGVKGRDVKENGVALCGHRNRDCHEYGDRLARRGIVYPDLTLQQMPESTYTIIPRKEKRVRKSRDERRADRRAKRRR